jgi:hypothetical protein
MASVTWRAQLAQVMPLIANSAATGGTEDCSKLFFKSVISHRS